MATPSGSLPINPYLKDNLIFTKLLENKDALEIALQKPGLSENEQKPSILVPANVLIPESKSKQIVLVKKGIATLVDVETGYRTATSVEITKGVEVGDTVVVAGMLFVRNGNKIKVGKTLSIFDIAK